MFHIVLYEPEIPPNTGNIMRLCANAPATLHLIEPLGFVLDDRRLRRAGLDYRDLAGVERHRDLAACRLALGSNRWLAFTTRGTMNHAEWAFQTGDVLMFGPETRGLPEAVLEQIPTTRHLRIPQLPGARSINLGNAVAIGLFEAWRQIGFAGDRGA
jgi:tRNA (cytidine/uridine-2'-O-)-methyltransferase